MASVPVFGIGFIFFVNTQILERIEVVGNRSIPRLTLQTQTGEIYDPVVLNRDRDSILARYGEEGFFWTRVSVDTTRVRNGLRVTFTVTEGRRAQFGRVDIKGADDPEILARALHPPGFFSQRGVESMIEQMLDYYEENGFPLAKINPTEFRIVSDSVYCTLVVDRGQEVILAGIDFVGPVATKSNVLTRLGKFIISSRYSETEIREAVGRFERTGLYAVTNYGLEQKEGKYILRIELTERKSNTAFGSLGYSAATGGLTGTFLLEFSNLFSTLRQARAFYEKTQSYLEFGLKYVEPWVLGFELSAAVEMNHRTYDTLSSHTELVAVFRAPLTPALKLQTDVGWERNVPFTETYWLGFGVTLDRLDYSPNPRKGVFYSIDSRLGERNPSGLSALKSALDGEADISIFKDFVFSSGIHGRDLTTADSLASAELFSLGGARSLRGYLEGEFPSPRIGWLQEEVRFLVGENSRLFLFGDGGGFKNGTDYEWRAGYGAGVRVETGLGILGLDYGVPWGEKFLRGKIHLSLEGRF